MVSFRICSTGAVCSNVTSGRLLVYESMNVTEMTQESLHQNYSNNYIISETEEQVSERVKYLENVDKLVWLIFAPVLLVTGLTGNTLSILVLKR